MASVKYPIVVWQDSQGLFTALTASGTYACAVDSDRRKCVEQIKKFLDWKHNKTQEGWDPYFDDPQIGQVFPCYACNVVAQKKAGRV